MEPLNDELAFGNFVIDRTSNRSQNPDAIALLHVILRNDVSSLICIRSSRKVNLQQNAVFSSLLLEDGV